MTRIALLVAMILGWLTAAPMPDSVSVGLVTCAPGQEIYELEGHAALHVRGIYQGQPVDAAVNWGVFDFNAPNFVYRFVKGETDYMCAASDWSRFVAPYMAQGREITEYVIDIDSVAADRLMALLIHNLEPQNRVYRYNYVKDNCATRPLTMLEAAMGDSIVLGQPSSADRLGGGASSPRSAAADHTFRQVMERYHRNYPWYQFGIDLALGSGIDYDITAREKSFAPAVLAEQLDAATIGGRPLVKERLTVYPGAGDVTLGPTPWYLTPLAAGWALFALVIAVTVYDIVCRRRSRWLDTLLYTAYGVAGLVVAFLVFVSTHEATSPNWLLLWLNPLCLVVPALIWLKKFKKIVFSYQIINFALVLTMIVAWPWTGQCGNLAFIPLIGADLLRSLWYIVTYMLSVKQRAQS